MRQIPAGIEPIVTDDDNADDDKYEYDATCSLRLSVVDTQRQQPRLEWSWYIFYFIWGGYRTIAVYILFNLI